MNEEGIGMFPPETQVDRLDLSDHFVFRNVPQWDQSQADLAS